jgi:hypothetical protein
MAATYAPKEGFKQTGRPSKSAVADFVPKEIGAA